MRVVTVKLNEESWAYIISDDGDDNFIEQNLTQAIDTAKALYPDCKISIYGIRQEIANQIIQKTKERRQKNV